MVVWESVAEVFVLLLLFKDWYCLRPLVTEFFSWDQSASKL